MALFDPRMFDPRYFEGSGLPEGILGGLGLLAKNMQQPEAPPVPQQTPTGPTYASGNMGSMGGVPFSIFGAPQDSAELPPNARPTGPAPMPGMGHPQPQQSAPPAQSQPLQAPPDPTMMDRLTAGANNLSSGGNPLAMLMNVASGLATGQRTDKMGMALAQQNSTYQALRQSGVPDAMARAATLNPDILKTIAPAYFDTAPKLQETGQDPITGQKTFSVYQPNKQTLTPIGGNQTTQGESLGAFGEAVKNGVQGDALYEYLPAAMRNTVKGMIEGRMPPPSTVAMRSPATLALINAANAIDPTFDATSWRSRNTFRTQMGSAAPSSVGGQKTLMGTALGHLGELADAAEALGNSNGMGIASVGWAMNKASQIGTEQAAKARKLEETADRFSGEVGKLYSGSQGGGVHERDATRARFGATNTPAELAAALEASRDLIHSKLTALEDQRDQVLGPASKSVDFLGDKGRESLARIDKAIAKLKGGGASQPATSLPPGWSVQVR